MELDHVMLDIGIISRIMKYTTQLRVIASLIPGANIQC